MNLGKPARVSRMKKLYSSQVSAFVIFIPTSRRTNWYILRNAEIFKAQSTSDLVSKKGNGITQYASIRKADGTPPRSRNSHRGDLRDHYDLTITSQRSRINYTLARSLSRVSRDKTGRFDGRRLQVRRNWIRRMITRDVGRALSCPRRNRQARYLGRRNPFDA